MGLTLADRLPLSKRLTSSNSVPVKESSAFSSGPGFLPEPKCSGRNIRGTLNTKEDEASASPAGTFLGSLIIFAFCQFIAPINLVFCNISGRINTVPLQGGQSSQYIFPNETSSDSTGKILWLEDTVILEHLHPGQLEHQTP